MRASPILAFVINIPIAFLVPSSSGHAALVMPILAPLADFAGVARSIAVTAFQSASGFVNYMTPTSAVVMGGLTLAKVRLRPLPPLRRSRSWASSSVVISHLHRRSAMAAGVSRR